MQWCHFYCLIIYPFKPSSAFITDRYKAVVLLWIFLMFLFQVCPFYTVLFVPCILVNTCWEKADLLALLRVMLPCVFVTFPLVSLVRCGSWFNDFWSLPTSLLLLKSVENYSKIYTYQVLSVYLYKMPGYQSWLRHLSLYGKLCIFTWKLTSF